MTAVGSRTPPLKHFFPFRRRCTLRPHSAAVNFLDFSRDGEFLLAASSDKSISLSAPLLGRHIASYGGSAHQAVVTCVSSGFGNASFLSTAADGRAFLWDVETQQVLRAFPRQKGQLKACLLLDVVEPPPRTSAAAAADRGPGGGSSSRFAGGQQQQQPRTSGCSDTRISQVAVMAGEDRAVRFFDIRQKNKHLACLEQLHDAKDSITCLLFTGSSLLASSADGCVYEYDIRKGRLHIDEIGQPVSSISLSGEGESLLLGCADGYIRLQERASGEVLLALAGHASKLQHYRLDAHFTLLDSRRRHKSPLPFSYQSSAAAACAAAALPHEQQLSAPLFPNRGRRRVKRMRRAQQQRQRQPQKPLQQEDDEQGQQQETGAAASLVKDEDSEASARLSRHAWKGSRADLVKKNEEQQHGQTGEEEEEAGQSYAETEEAAASWSSLSDDEDVSDDYFSSSADEEEGPPVYRLCVLSGSEDGALVGWDLQTAAAAEEEDEQQQQPGCMVIRKRIHAHSKRSSSPPAEAAPRPSASVPSSSPPSSAAGTLEAAAENPPPAAAARSFATPSHALPQRQREPVALLSLRLEETHGLVVTGASDGVIKVWKKR